MFLRWVGLGLVASIQLSTASGSFAGNGGDSINPRKLYAWFSEPAQSSNPDQKIHWCLDRGEDFQLDETQTKSIINKAIDQWKSYLVRKELALFWDFHFDEACSDKTDLKFILGKINDQILKDKAQYLEPFAFAEKTSWNESLTWSQGYIWIENGELSKDPFRTKKRPDWSQPFALQGILLHELGHVLGCRHVAGTIMRPDIAKALLTETKVRGEVQREDGSIFNQSILDSNLKRILSVIDSNRELYFGDIKPAVFYAVYAPPEKALIKTKEKELAKESAQKLFAKIAPEAKVPESFIQRLSIGRGDEDDQRRVTFEVELAYYPYVDPSAFDSNAAKLSSLSFNFELTQSNFRSFPEDVFAHVRLVPEIAKVLVMKGHPSRYTAFGLGPQDIRAVLSRGNYEGGSNSTTEMIRLSVENFSIPPFYGSYLDQADFLGK